LRRVLAINAFFQDYPLWTIFALRVFIGSARLTVAGLRIGWKRQTLDLNEGAGAPVQRRRSSLAIRPVMILMDGGQANHQLTRALLLVILTPSVKRVTPRPDPQQIDAMASVEWAVSLLVHNAAVRPRCQGKEAADAQLAPPAAA
jgi:hypothetical protein